MAAGMRIGIGYDLHRTAAGRPLVLGGVRIEADRGLVGHSDADIVLHALTDALLGTVGEGDIGELFPDTDPRYKDADSRIFLAEALRRVREAGFVPVNADLVLHAERPRLSPFKAQIRESVAALLGLPAQRVGLKATTNEGLDAIGRGEAMACWAAVMLGGSPS